MREYVGKHAFVVAVTPVRRRPWAAPLWVEAMAAQTRRPDAVLVAHDDDPESAEDRESQDAWAREVIASPHEWSAWACFYPRPSAPGWSRTGPERYSDDGHAHLAALRNWTVKRALELWPQATHIWSCDSDVQPDPDALELLLAADKDICGAVVRNSSTAYNFMLGWHADSGEPCRTGAREMGLADLGREPVRVTMTGACALYRADLFRGRGLGGLDRQDGFGVAAGLLRWGPHRNGEDVALAIQAREMGIEMYVEPRARTRHWLGGPDEEPLR